MTIYPTNVSNSQWQVISIFLDTKRSRKHCLREVLNGVLYLVKTGCQWRMLPSDFPNWPIVYYYYSVWKKIGMIEDIHDFLVEKTRKEAGRDEEPTIGVIDAQSVKNTLVSCEDKGFDAGKKIKGIKRHIIMDSTGLILAVAVQGASMQDRDGAVEVITKLLGSWKKVVRIFADGGYRGKLIGKVKKCSRIDIDIIRRDELHTFKVLPKRWIVERTFAWIDTNRRNSKNYERLNETSVAMVHLSAIRIMLNRFLTASKNLPGVKFVVWFQGIMPLPLTGRACCRAGIQCSSCPELLLIKVQVNKQKPSDVCQAQLKHKNDKMPNCSNVQPALQQT